MGNESALSMAAELRAPMSHVQSIRKSDEKFSADSHTPRRRKVRISARNALSSLFVEYLDGLKEIFVSLTPLNADNLGSTTAASCVFRKIN